MLLPYNFLKQLVQTPNAVEKMDCDSLSEKDLIEIENGLARMNTLSGSFYRTALWMHKHYLDSNITEGKNFSLLDLGCGGGGLLRYLFKYAKKKNLKISFFGIDINEGLLAVAKKQNLFENQINYSSSRLGAHNTKYSLIYSNLVLHHLNPDEISSFLGITKEYATISARHEDLIRSRLTLLLTFIFPRMVSRNSIVHHDGFISTYRAYSKREFKKLASENNYNFRKVFPERAQLET